MSKHKYNELKEFMAKSRVKWNKLYPEFRSHSDGDKLAAYKIVEDVPDLYIPRRFKKLNSVWELTSDIIRNIEADAFVVKANLGNQGRRVICLHRRSSDTYSNKLSNNFSSSNGVSNNRSNYSKGSMIYKDILRHHSYDMNLGQTVAYIINSFKRDEESKGSALFIEEFIGNPLRGLPQDYKLYAINGKVKLISIFGRRGRDEYANSYDRNWRPIPMSAMYKYPDTLDYIEQRQPLDNLPNNNMRNKLIELAEILAQKHRTDFCRYDFYCVNDKVYFGEITPVCGDLNNYRVLESFATFLLPPISIHDSDADAAEAPKVDLKMKKDLKSLTLGVSVPKIDLVKGEKELKKEEDMKEKKDRKEKKNKKEKKDKVTDKKERTDGSCECCKKKDKKRRHRKHKSK